MNQPSVHLDRSLVYSPGNNYLYNIDGELSGRKVSVILSGTSKYSWFDFSSLRYKREHRAIQCVFKGRDFIMIPKETLPYEIKKYNLPPLLAYSERECANNVLGIEFLKIDISNRFSSRLSYYPYTSIKVTVINSTLQAECQKLFPDIKVVAGGYPIFFEKNRPSFDCIAQIYEEFITYNTKDKLEFQNRISQDFCYMRAHLTSVILDHYRISSVLKVYKFWDIDDWHSFSSDNEWGFHCAVMIIDDEDRYWIWDPWVGFNPRLLSLRDWVKREDEPTPYKLLITNKANILNLEGKVPDTPYFSEVFPGNLFRLFQGLCGDAISYPPERPLPINTEEEKQKFNKKVPSIGYIPV